MSTKLATAVSWAALAFGLLFLAFIGWYIPTSRRGYIALFRDFDVELPRATWWMLTMPGLVFPAAALTGAIAMIAVQWLVRERRVAAIFHIFVVALGGVTLLIYHLTLAQPLSHLLEGLSK